MALYFVDNTKTEGRIDDDFTIEYDGPVDVEEYVEDLQTEATSRDKVMEDIILDLRIQEVRRED